MVEKVPLTPTEAAQFNVDALIHVVDSARFDFGKINGRWPRLVNRPLLYADIREIGWTRRRWWIWMLIWLPTTVVGGIVLLTPHALSNKEHDTFVMIYAAFVIIPLFLFVHGRPWLYVAGEHETLAFPLWRRRAAMARVLGLLSRTCPPPGVRWMLQGSRFEDPATWDRENTGNWVQPPAITWGALFLGVFAAAFSFYTDSVALQVFWGLAAKAVAIDLIVAAIAWIRDRASRLKAPGPRQRL